MNEPYDPPAASASVAAGNRFSSASQDGLLPNAAQPASSTRDPDKQKRKIQDIQAEVDSTRRELDKTVKKLQERGELMDDLQTKTDSLSIHSRAFKTEGRRVHRKMWWKNLKWTICLGVLVVLIIAGAVAGGIKGTQVIKEKTVVHETPSATLLPGSGSNTATGAQISTVDISKESNA